MPRQTAQGLHLLSGLHQGLAAGKAARIAFVARLPRTSSRCRAQRQAAQDQTFYSESSASHSASTPDLRMPCRASNRVSSPSARSRFCLRHTSCRDDATRGAQIPSQCDLHRASLRSRPVCPLYAQAYVGGSTTTSSRGNSPGHCRRHADRSIRSAERK